MKKRPGAEKKESSNESKVSPVAKLPSGYEPVREKHSFRRQRELLNGTELFSKFTADIIKEDVFFTR